MQMNNFNTGQMPVAEPVIKHVQKRSVSRKQGDQGQATEHDLNEQYA